MNSFDQQSKTHYYGFLDSLRAVAVLWILFHHIFVFLDLKPLLGASFTFISQLASVGVFGVDMFFVISGFLISGLLLADWDRGPLRVKRFYFRRFLKIIPQYVIAICLGTIIGMIFHIRNEDLPANCDALMGIWINVAMIQNYFPNIQLPTLAHLWTIAVEEQFYFLFPLLLTAGNHFLKDARQKRTGLLMLCLFFIILENLARFHSITQIIKAGHGTFYSQYSHVHSDGLICGIIIKLIEPYLVSITGWRRFTLSTISLIAGITIYLYFILFGIDMFFWPTLGLAYLAPAFLIIALLLNDGFLRKFFENAVSRWIGKNSYAIYLWHYPTIISVLVLFGPHANFLIILAYLFITILAGFLSTITIERYFLNMRGT